MNLLLFDPARVSVIADYADPNSLPVGIAHVLVNGDFVVRKSVLTNTTPGRVLHRHHG